MKSLVYRVSLCEIYFYNCVECGVPIFSESARRAGLCGHCGMGRMRKRVAQLRRIAPAEQAWLDANDDPYGRPAAVAPKAP